MPLSVGARLGPYEVIAALGAGGMSACGHASARTGESEREPQRQYAVGVGPHRQWKK